MALVFKDQQVLVLSPGSDVTNVQMGMSESLLPASVEIPTVVYKRRDNGLYQGTAPEPTDQTDNASEGDSLDGLDAIRPIQQGAIVDEAAFHYFLKLVYNSVAPKQQYPLPPAIYITTALVWNRRQIERLVQYLFEVVGVPAVAFCLQGVVCAYAYAASECLVIDIGYDKTEITPVLNFSSDTHAAVVVPCGGSSINKALASKLGPQGFTDTQIEDLKRSPIFEVLSADSQETENAQRNSSSDDAGVVDVAAIVASGRTREILEERERMKQGDVTVVSNFELPTNTFTDRNGVEHTVGRERFEGTDELIKSIVDGVGEVLYRLGPRQQQLVFDNVIIAGRGSSVSGLRDRLLQALEEKHVLKNTKSPAEMQSVNPLATNQEVSLQQAPTSITIARVLDHFPEWKSQGAESLGFLGAQIGAKQSFTAGLEGVFASRQDYNEDGPGCIWDVYL